MKPRRSPPPPPSPETPFSRPFEVEKAMDVAVTVEIEAKPEELLALAALCKLPAIGRLSARLVVSPAGRHRFEVTGTVRGQVTQVCVVSLESFDTDIVEPVEVFFASPEEVERLEAKFAKRRDEGDDAEADEPPDPIINGWIDLGGIAAEFLVLGLDPYPRKPGVEYAVETGTAGDLGDVSPFAALAKLKKKEDGA